MKAVMLERSGRPGPRGQESGRESCWVWVWVWVWRVWDCVFARAAGLGCSGLCCCETCWSTLFCFFAREGEEFVNEDRFGVFVYSNFSCMLFCVFANEGEEFVNEERVGEFEVECLDSE